MIILEILFGIFVLSYYFVFMFAVLILNFFFRGGAKRTAAELQKHPGPFTNAEGQQVYIWIDRIGEREQGVIGVEMEFRLLSYSPPPDRQIPVEKNTHRHTRVAVYDLEDSAHYSFALIPFLPVGHLPAGAN